MMTLPIVKKDSYRKFKKTDEWKNWEPGHDIKDIIGKDITKLHSSIGRILGTAAKK